MSVHLNEGTEHLGWDEHPQAAHRQPWPGDQRGNKRFQGREGNKGARAPAVGQSGGMLWGAAPHGRCGEEHHPSRKAAHKLETTPQPHQSPPRTAGQDSFCTTLTFPPSQIPFKPQLWQIWSCPMVWQAHGSGSGSKQPFARVPAAPSPARSPPSNFKHPLSDQQKSPLSCPSHSLG